MSSTHKSKHSSSSHGSTSSSDSKPSSRSKPIPIAKSRTKVVIIQLPPHTRPPVLSSSPSHRTAPHPHPVLISSSYPGRHHLQGSSPPRVTYAFPSSAPHSQPSGLSPPFRPRQSSITTSGGSPPTRGTINGSPSMPYHHVTRASGSAPTAPIPVGRASSHDSFARATITRSDLEDEYYSHPAVREYELQKAAEQARWTRHRMMERERARVQVGDCAKREVSGLREREGRPLRVSVSHHQRY
ncbi:hypothetical protein DFP72DRAFT_528666 [Ephemerocybe angulata]|uniref:Uncharacterized protein n=1 Tax=Ephemerocybe angulata TaxID=980116 RepID=A0A8H6IG95_9AGAR|nr:hypothetical protein DFP72DRAFT_528666 [Tulosesus angulatus]